MVMLVPRPTLLATPASVPELRGMSILWHGGDGSVWDVGNNPESPAHLMSGARGFYFPPIDNYRTESAGVDGAQRRGGRTRSRQVFWPIQLLTAQRSQDWYDFEASFLDSLIPGTEGAIEVIQPKGATRRLRVYLEDAGDTAIETDPALIGWVRHSIYFQADQPYWEGEEVSFDFGGGATGSFTGPDRIVSSSFNLASARVRNPGQIEAWPRYIVRGPSTSVTIGLDGHNVTYPGTMVDGDVLVLDSDPTANTAVLNGMDVTGSLTARDWTPIPPPAAGQEDVPLTINMVGTGTVTVAFKPLFWRAW